MNMVRDISEKAVESDDDEDGEDGEAEVVALAKRCLELSSGKNGKKTLSEG